jgi:hypothetical protein
MSDERRKTELEDVAATIARLEADGAAARSRMKKSIAIYALFSVTWVAIQFAGYGNDDRFTVPSMILMATAVFAMPRRVAPMQPPDAPNPLDVARLHEAYAQLKALEWQTTKVRLAYLAATAVFFVLLPKLVGP